MKDINEMLNKEVQKYYAKEYLHYQKTIIENNKGISDDRIMISKFIKKLKMHGDIIDIGCGNCQWFPLFANKINHYYALEVNKKALFFSPKDKKIIPICKNIFDEDYHISKSILSRVECVFFSFFLSHFSDSTISELFQKISGIDSIIIVDSLWGAKHKIKHSTKELQKIERKISEKDHIKLPKRFFDFSDLEKIGRAWHYSITDFLEGNYWFICKMKKL
ncbi:hypothetical protein [Clostridium sp.]|uniref:hypothetical protein n=1 Tax=Clostridium sp. TaxID=1506 RepID=UPI002844350E|nr:hypothetical protein [Clostridium sp.]MDR3596501.1 hypothetical protein [Clostridium sp.]